VLSYESKASGNDRLPTGTLKYLRFHVARFGDMHRVFETSKDALVCAADSSGQDRKVHAIPVPSVGKRGLQHAQGSSTTFKVVVRVGIHGYGHMDPETWNTAHVFRS
jgi:hypothetical protein